MTEVVVLGSEPVSIDAAVPREERGKVDDLLADPPRAVIVADEGERCFFRASLAFERGVSRVVIRPGSVPEPWLLELATRAYELGGELWVRDDARYQRIRPGRGPRIEVGAPVSYDVELPSRYPPLPAIDRVDVRCEEVAFAIDLKPVLYLVVELDRVEALRAEHPRMVTVEDRVQTSERSGVRSYGVGAAVAHVFVGEEAERAATLWEKGSSENVAELGALMGYPKCCVRAFAAMTSRSVNAAFPYVTAARTRAFDQPFDPRLDVSTARLVPFVPCSYACPRAIAWAARVAEAAGIESVARDVIFVDEARSVIVTPSGARWAGDLDDPLRRAFPERGPLPEVGVLLPFGRSAMIEGE